MPDVFDEIRVACRDVAAGARHVRFREERIAPFAAELPDPEEASGLDPRHHWLGHGEGSAVYILLLDQVNFGSGWSEHLRKPPGLSTYTTTASKLARWIDWHGVPTPARVLQMQAADVALLFGQEGHPPESPAHELMALWAQSLRDLATLVHDRFHGEWLGPLRAARGSAAELVRTLGSLPLGRDVQPWRGREVPFFKRAQITVADLAQAGAGAWWGRWHDLDRLTMFADNLVPHVLRMEGVLEYEPGLLARIERGEELPRDSEEEVEIRACGLHAVERLVEALAEARRPAAPWQVDQLLWTRGQSPRIKARRRHRTRTSFY